MSEKLTLSRYLKGGGEVKTLTRVEAIVFGIPYPLQPGWPRKYGALSITDEMLEDIKARILVAKESTAASARRRLAGLDSEAAMQTRVPAATQAALPARNTPVAGFVLRQAKRYRSRIMLPAS